MFFPFLFHVFPSFFYISIFSPTRELFTVRAVPPKNISMCFTGRAVYLTWPQAGRHATHAPRLSFWRLRSVSVGNFVGTLKTLGQVWAKASPGASRTSSRRMTTVDWLGDADDVQPENCDDGWSPRLKAAQWLAAIHPIFYCFVGSKRYLKCICVLAFQKPFAPLFDEEPVSWMLFNAKLSSFRFRVSCYILLSVFARPRTIQNCAHLARKFA